MMLRRRIARGVGILSVTSLLLVSGGAWGHGLRLTASVTETGIAGRAFYSDESPAHDERVAVRNAAGNVSLSARTDGQGRFAIELKESGRYTITVSGEEGHRAEVTLPFVAVSRDKALAAACGDSQALAAAMRGELAPLREDIARYEQRIRLHDLIGGVGLIVGLAGAFAFWRSRSRRMR